MPKDSSPGSYLPLVPITHTAVFGFLAPITSRTLVIQPHIFHTAGLHVPHFLIGSPQT